MPQSSAAIPRGRRHDQAPTDVVSEPGERHQLVCPVCRHGDQLQHVVPGRHFNAINAWAVVDGRITFPVVETVELDVEDPEVASDERADGIRCGRCRWSFTGPHPVTKLVPET